VTDPTVPTPLADDIPSHAPVAPARILLTGATGFIGSHLAARLIADGHAVHAIVRPASNLDLLNAVIAPLPPDRLILHPFAGDTGELAAIVARARPEVVFHVASRFIARHAPADVTGLVAANVLFGTQLLDAMAAHGVVRLVNTGTAWQHYQGAAYDPVNLYAATKQAFEAVARYYAQAAGVRILTLKLFDTYGPRDPRRKLIPLLREAIRTGRPLPLSGGEQKLDPVYVDDVTDAYARAAARLLGGGGVAPAEAPEEGYAVATGAPLTLRELVVRIEGVIGAAVPVAWGALPYRAREVMTPWPGGRPVPGWRPRVSLDEGLRRTFGAA